MVFEVLPILVCQDPSQPQGSGDQLALVPFQQQQEPVPAVKKSRAPRVYVCAICKGTSKDRVV